MIIKQKQNIVTKAAIQKHKKRFQNYHRNLSDDEKILKKYANNKNIETKICQTWIEKKKKKKKMNNFYYKKNIVALFIQSLGFLGKIKKI